MKIEKDCLIEVELVHAVKQNTKKRIVMSTSCIKKGPAITANASPNTNTDSSAYNTSRMTMLKDMTSSIRSSQDLDLKALP
jgi:hypothetical protein